MRKTPKVLELEERFGKPIQEILSEAFNRHGSNAAAARSIGVSRQLFENWFWKSGVRLEKRAVVPRETEVSA